MNSTTHDEGQDRRSAQDELLIAALASGRSYADAASIAGVSARTVSRRMSDARFARRVADRRGEQVVAIAGRITSMTAEALNTIRDCLGDDRPELTRLAAARLVLDWTFKFRRGEDSSIAVAEIGQHLGLGLAMTNEREIERLRRTAGAHRRDRADEVVVPMGSSSSRPTPTISGSISTRGKERSSS